MTKKIVSLLLVVVLLVPAVSYAGARINPSGKATSLSGDIESGTTVVKASSGLVYDIAINALAANAKVTLFDNSTGATGTAKYEVSVPTSGDSKVIDFADPIDFDNGIVVTVTNGAAFINYQ